MVQTSRVKLNESFTSVYPAQNHHGWRELDGGEVDGGEEEVTCSKNSSTAAHHCGPVWDGPRMELFTEHLKRVRSFTGLV